MLAFIIGLILGMTITCLSVANERKNDEREIEIFKKEAAYWEREAKKWCGKLGEARIRIEEMKKDI